MPTKSYNKSLHWMSLRLFKKRYRNHLCLLVQCILLQLCFHFMNIRAWPVIYASDGFSLCCVVCMHVCLPVWGWGHQLDARWLLGQCWSCWFARREKGGFILYHLRSLLILTVYWLCCHVIVVNFVVLTKQTYNRSVSVSLLLCHCVSVSVSLLL